MSPQPAGERDARDERGPAVAEAAAPHVDADNPEAVLRTHVFDAADLRRALTRIAHEIVERNHGAENVVLVGLYTRGVALAQRIGAAIGSFESSEPAIGMLDVAFYRDDIGLRPVAPTGPTEVPDLKGKVAVLVDDVLYTGRTVRAALDALHELGRPRAVQLAVLVDRGHRELPIRADYVGKNLPTRATEDVRVRLAEVDGDDGVDLWGADEREEHRR
jgi:pyrimidine operon attenuation protein/uracil phosphoribosyltransferase